MAETQGRQVPMRVIVLGAMRTGTLSIRHALFKLGYHDVHHMYSVFNDIETVPMWVRALKSKSEPSPANKPLTKADWDSLLGSCQGVCDIPSSFFPAELVQHYPEAKVVVLNRDPESWHKSVLSSIVANTVALPLWEKLKVAWTIFFDREFQLHMKFTAALANVATPLKNMNKEAAFDWYDDFYREIREAVPAEKRLEYKITDGWGPLCDWLGVPVPMERDETTGEMKEVPFPWMHEQKDFKRSLEVMRSQSRQRAVRVIFEMIGKTTVVGAVGYGLYKLAGAGTVVAWWK